MVKYRNSFNFPVIGNVIDVFNRREGVFTRFLVSFLSLASVSPPLFLPLFFPTFHVHYDSYLADIRLVLRADFSFKCLFSPSVYCFFVWLLASVKQY